MNKNRKRLKQTQWFSTAEWRPHYSRVGWYKCKYLYTTLWFWARWNGYDFIDDYGNWRSPSFFKGVIR